MMIYLLDTNTCIQYLTGRSENVINKFKTTHRENICLCDVVKAELYYGACRSVKKEQNLALYEFFFLNISAYLLIEKQLKFMVKFVLNYQN